MSQDSTSKLHSIISRLVLNIETNSHILNVAESIGVPQNNRPDFVIGLLYSASQTLFRKETGLDDKVADDIFTAFWKNEGKEIRKRVIQAISKKE